jgi:sugar O-acyltransferase (sialic acid O-acetyltransferase NeuD family)
MENIIIIGSSGHAKIIIDIVERAGKFKIVGLLDRFRNAGEQTLGYPILGKEEDLPKLTKTHAVKGVFVAVGDNYDRSKVAAHVREISPNLPFVSVIHPDSSIASNVSIGEGTVVMAGVTISPNASAGRFCVLSTNSNLAHDSVLEDFASLAPTVAMGGYCQIGQYSAIAIGAVLLNNIHIGEQSIIGAGALVNKPIKSFSVAYGTPAKVVRSRKPGDEYL